MNSNYITTLIIKYPRLSIKVIDYEGKIFPATATLGQGMRKWKEFLWIGIMKSRKEEFINNILADEDLPKIRSLIIGRWGVLG